MVLLAGGSFAQGQLRHLPQAPKTAIPAGPNFQSVHANTAGEARDGSTCIFSEDFENMTTLGELTAQGWNAAQQVEQAQNEDDGAGLGTFVPAWRIGTAAALSSTYLKIPDSPAGNHLIAANDDGAPCNCIMDSVVLVTPSIDFSGHTDMSLSFRGFSDEGFDGGQMKVFASRNGGGAWELVHTVAPMARALQHIVVDLSAFDGEPNVKIAWKWSDEGAWATGVAVDDICVAPILENNLTLQQVYSADVTVNNLEYTYVPLEQAQPIDVSAIVINNGSQEQTNLVATATVALNGTTVGTYASSPLPALARGEVDTLVIHTHYVPAEAGEVAISVTVGADRTDDFTGDNSGESNIRITNPSAAGLHSAWGRDHDAAESFGGGVNLFRIANLLEVVNPGSIAYGVEVAFGDADPDVIVQAQLLDANSANFDP
ncbi:MAG: choice-of-anchor J domain-containing protein [Flavobacteriales bacterium]